MAKCDDGGELLGIKDVGDIMPRETKLSRNAAGSVGFAVPPGAEHV